MLPYPIKTPLTILLLLLGAISIDASVVIAEEKRDLVYDPESILFIPDPEHNLTIEEIQRADHWQLWQDTNILNFGMTQSAYWVKMDLDHMASEQYLRLKAPLLDSIDIYFVTNNGAIDHRQAGAAYAFSQREIQALDYLFKIPQGKSTAYIRLQSNFALQVPIEIASLAHFNQSSMQQYWGLGLYFGLMLVMILYNLFIYLSVQDKTYLYYILYISSITLTYASFKGISFQYIWDAKPYFNTLVPTIASLPAIFIILFAMSFLGISRKDFPNTLRLCYSFILIFLICCLANILGDYYFSANLSQISTSVMSVYMLFIPIVAYRRGIKTARFFLLAWTLYFISVIIYILQLQAVISYTEFTNNATLYGSAIEAVLISFALADRINTLKREKDLSQQQALQLKSKILETEKLVSLGQLTAGIAHEINNPLTFIKANIKPLKRNLSAIQQVSDRYAAITSPAQWQEQAQAISAFKQKLDYDYIQPETQMLLDGIEEGANRTVTIVEGLKSFSRLGSGDFQLYKLETGIELTLTLLGHQLRDNMISISKDYGNDITVNCLPDRINQVFMNILSNSIDELKEKNGDNPEISIVLSTDQDWVTVQIGDNGMGIDESAKSKLFDPFFTTKTVGSGTGLGLSIVYGIIQDHNGTISVDSVLNKETVFTLKLPLYLPREI